MGGAGGGVGGTRANRGDSGCFTEEVTLKCWEFTAKKGCKGSDGFLSFFLPRRKGKEHFHRERENFFFFHFGGLFSCVSKPTRCQSLAF